MSHLLTVGAVVDRFLAHARATQRYCPEALADRQRALLEFAAHLGKLSPLECCPDDLAQWIEAHPQWKASNTKRARCQWVQTCFTWAVKVGRLARNPFAGLVYEEGEPRGATDDAHLARMMERANLGMRRLLWFQRQTGCRPCELRKVLWEEVDWARGCIVHWKHKTRRKTRKPRLIPLSAEVLDLLRRMLSEGGTGEIFRNAKGNPWKKQALVLHWQRLRARAHCPRSATMHGIRHRAATEAIRNGGNIKLVSLGLGHASVTTTERYYCHLTDEVDAVRRELERGRLVP